MKCICFSRFKKLPLLFLISVGLVGCDFPSLVENEVQLISPPDYQCVIATLNKETQIKFLHKYQDSKEITLEYETNILYTPRAYEKKLPTDAPELISLSVKMKPTEMRLVSSSHLNDQFNPQEMDEINKMMKTIQRSIAKNCHINNFKAVCNGFINHQCVFSDKQLAK